MDDTEGAGALNKAGCGGCECGCGVRMGAVGAVWGGVRVHGTGWERVGVEVGASVDAGKGRRTRMRMRGWEGRQMTDDG